MNVYESDQREIREKLNALIQNKVTTSSSALSSATNEQHPSSRRKRAEGIRSRSQSPPSSGGRRLQAGNEFEVGSEENRREERQRHREEQYSKTGDRSQKWIAPYFTRLSRADANIAPRWSYIKTATAPSYDSVAGVSSDSPPSLHPSTIRSFAEKGGKGRDGGKDKLGVNPSAPAVVDVDCNDASSTTTSIATVSTNAAAGVLHKTRLAPKDHLRGSGARVHR